MRVRFAPSPTGHLHLGGLRTALYNYLLARQSVTGSFILRIEDTDQKRTVPGATDEIISLLNWTGLSFDEGPGKSSQYGPFFQSMRLEMYQNAASQLLKSGLAYKCFCSSERLFQLNEINKLKKLPPKYDNRCRHLSFSELTKNAGFPHVIRFKVPESDSSSLEDFILLKSDGWPTYHLASIVDDHHMKIDTVIRGKEWLPSVPKHLALYSSFGWQPPKFVHLPLLVNPDGSKLSKRTEGAMDFRVSTYKSRGYLPEALCNYVALLGWAPETNNRFFTMNDLIKEFSLDRINADSSIVDQNHMEYLQKLHFSHCVQQQQGRPLISQLRQALLDNYGTSIPPDLLKDSYLYQIIAALSTRVPNVNTIAKECNFFWFPPPVPQTVTPESVDITKAFLKALDSMPTQTSNEFLNIIYSMMKSNTNQSKSTLMFLRTLITGTPVGPSLNDVFYILGKETLYHRCQAYLQREDRDLI